VTDTPGFGVPEPRVPAPDPFTQGMQAGLAHQPTDAPASWAHPDNLHNDQQPPLKTAAEMMKSNFTKAQVQQYCRDHGITDDLAHTKAKLIEKLNAKGKLAHPGAAQATAAPTVHPAQTEAFRTMVLSKIGNAASAGELQTINRDVVRQGGDQAWTDAMTEAARVRVGQLDAVTPQSDGNVLDKIRAASVPQDLAKLWEEITIGGSVPGNWTPAIDQASHARLAELNAARPPAPVNPFGP
jgi:hypothetical protein